jgi:corrinoid protein of di/trimethylamine methyltransferase
MIRTKPEILRDLADAVVEMEEKKAVELALEVLECGIDPYVAIMDGLSKGMELVGKKYEIGEYFIPQLIVCSDAMYAGIEVLRPHIVAESVKTFGKVVIGVVEGDTHDIGKNLVKMMLEASGFEVHDLGRDVPLRRFVEESERVSAQMICMSTLMTTAMDGMEEVMAMLDAEGVRNKYRVLIGGGPISQKYADRIRADGYAPNAAAAVKKAKELVVSNE